MPTIDEIKQITSPIFADYDVKKAEIFGSFASGKANSDSDVDMVVSLKRPVGLLTFFKMNNQLEEALGREVDLATPASINPRLAEKIKDQLIPVYEG